MEIDEQCLNSSIIDLTNRTEGISKKYTTTPYRSDLKEVQNEDNVVLPSQESMNNGFNLFDYNSYDNYDNRFNRHLEYGKGYENRIAFKDGFYG